MIGPRGVGMNEGLSALLNLWLDKENVYIRFSKQCPLDYAQRKWWAVYLSTKLLLILLYQLNIGNELSTLSVRLSRHKSDTKFRAWS